MYTYHIALRLRDTDAVGGIYFANLFNLAQEALEAFIDSADLDIGTVLRDTSFIFPVVHAEADIHHPILPGQKLRVQLTLHHMGTTSFTLCHRILPKENHTSMATIRIVHVVVDRATGRKQPVPEELRAILDRLTERPMP